MKKTAFFLGLVLTPAIFAHEQNSDHASNHSSETLSDSPDHNMEHNAEHHGEDSDNNNNNHNHGHEESVFDIESYVLTLKGSQAFGEACYLGVRKEGLSEDGLYYADVESSFSHDGSGAGVLRVTQDARNPLLLTATKEDGSRISIQLADKGTKISDSLKYAVRWAHGNHFDTGLCSNLEVIHDLASEKDECDSASSEISIP